MGNMLVKFSKHKSSSNKKYPTVIEELCHRFSLDDIKKSTNNFERRIETKDRLGKTYKGCLKYNDESDYPIAVLNMDDFYPNFKVWAMKITTELHCQLHHPNLISLIGFCHTKKDEVYLVYEYMPNGSLYDHLQSRDMESLSWKKRLEICIGAARGLHYLHTGAKRPIFHRNIKPSNILLDSKMEPKLTQLDTSLQGKPSKSNQEPIAASICGTVGFMAPEIWAACSTITNKCDVYSFGMLLINVAYTNQKHTFKDIVKLLHQQADADNCWDTILDGDQIIDPIHTRLIAPQCLALFKDITKRCLMNDPNERPTMGEVEVELEHALALQEEWEK